MFLIKLKGQDNYIRVPLAAFAVQSDSDGAYGQGNCELYVQYIDTDDESTIVLGSMILAQFVTSFEVTGDINPDTGSQIGYQYFNVTAGPLAMPLTYIGNETWSDYL